MGVITDWGTAIVTSFASAMAMVFAFVPKLLGFLVILLIGWIVATVLAKAITLLLRKMGFDNLANRIGLTRFEQQMGLHMDAAELLGKVVYWFVFLVFLVPAVDALGLSSVSALLDQVIAYIPNVFVAIIVLLLGGLLAKIAADLVRGTAASAHLGNPNLLSNITRYVIVGFVCLVALYQLQIAPGIIQSLFTAIIGAAALAFGLAFGLGGRDTAKRYLDRSEVALSGGTAEGTLTQPTMHTDPRIAQVRSSVQQQNQAMDRRDPDRQASDLPVNEQRRSV